jgi:hypothetical protein
MLQYESVLTRSEHLIAASVSVGDVQVLFDAIALAATPVRISYLWRPMLEWTDIDFAKRQLTVARSEWKGHVTMPKGGRLRYVPITRRLTEALREARHLRGPRVLCDGTGKALTQKVVQVLVRRTARRANVKPGIHILRHSFCSHLAMWGASKSHPGTRRTPGPGHDAALHAPEPGGARRSNQVIGDRDGYEPRGRGEIMEAAGTEGPKAHIP